MAYYNEYRIRKGLFGKSVLQQWHCFPTGIQSALAGTCSWADVDYKSAPNFLFKEPKGNALSTKEAE